MIRFDATVFHVLHRRNGWKLDLILRKRAFCFGGFYEAQKKAALKRTHSRRFAKLLTH
jgi:hypothetical protein